MEDTTNNVVTEDKAIEVDVTAGGITAKVETNGFKPEGDYASGAHKVNTPIRDEGVEDTKDEYSDATMLKLFGKEAATVLGIEEKEAIDESIETNILNTSTQKPAETEIPQESIPTTIPDSSITPVDSSSIPPSKTYTEEELNDILNTKLTEEVQKFQHINTFFEEYQKDPYNYMAKHSPHLFEKFDEVKYVKDKLAEEFGEFTPDGQRVYQIGTTDYNFRIRQDQLLSEAQSLKTQAVDNLQAKQSAIDNDEQSYKTAKAKALGMNISDFETKIWKSLKTMDNQTVLDTLVDAFIYKEKLAEKDANIKQQIDLTKGVPSPSNVSGAGKPAEKDKDMELLISMFGPK